MSDVSNCKMEREIKSPVEIWKIRYTPFGDGLVTLSKEYGVKDQNVVMLWSAKNLSSPVHQFIGHSECIIEFCWRFLGEKENKYQLVSYAEDLSMRLWHIDARLKDLCQVDHLDDDDDESQEDQGRDTADLEMEFASQSQFQDSSENVARNGEDHDSHAATESEVGNSLMDDGDDNAEVVESRAPCNNTQSKNANRQNGNVGTGRSANEDETIFKLDSSALARTPSLPTLSTAENSASAVSTASLSSEEDDRPVSMETTSDEPVTSGMPPKTVAIICERRDSGVISSASNVAMSAMTVPINRSTASVSGAAGEGGGGSADGSAASSLRVPGASVAGGGGGAELASSAPELNFEPAPLLQEFILLHLSDNLVLEKSDVGDRVIIIVGKAGAHRLRLRIDFPAAYPMAKPQISMEDIEGTLGARRLEELRKRLVTVAEHHFSRTKRCVEMCQRQFEIVVDSLIREEQSETENDYVSPLSMLGGLRNANIPFPRTCGARFDGADKLVVFGVRTMPVVSKGGKYSTPRSFSAIANFILGQGTIATAVGTPSKGKGGSASGGEGAKLMKTPSTTSRRSARSRSSAGSSISEDLRPYIDNYSRCVLVYNCLATQPFNLNLARKYCISLKTMPANCYTNLGIAFNEATKKRVRIQRRGTGGRTVSGGGAGDAASQASFNREKAEILKTWEILAFTVRPYEYRR